MRLVKIAVKLFLVWMTVFCMAGWIHADELSAIKDGYNSYWSKIKDGKGSCTVINQRFSSDNSTTPQGEVKDTFEWMFAGQKVRFTTDSMPTIINGQKVPPASMRSATEIYFDGQRVTISQLKTSLLRKPNISDIGYTNSWDPRCVVTGSIRSEESWKPTPFWSKETYKIVGKEKIGGYECYVLETATAGKSGRYVNRYWFDAERNFCLVRNELWVVVDKDAVLPEGLEWTKNLGKYLRIHTEIELKKYGKEFWGPKKYEMVVYSPDPKTKTFYIYSKTTKIYDDSCAYNLGLTENDLRIVLPPDAKISDASKYPTDYVKPKVSIEFRTTKNIPFPGFWPVNTPNNKGIVYVLDKAEITEADISGVKVDFGMGSLPRLQISFTEKGVEKLIELTQNHLNERIAIFIDGKLTNILVVKEIPHGTSLTLSLDNLTEAEIKRIIGD